jgi:TGF-beta propeptide
MRIAILLSALTLLAASPGQAATVSLSPVEDVGLPFWCDWGYDWDERCYRDDGARLPVGGVDDKVWRSALRFSFAAIPSQATITYAELRIVHDGVCVGPRRTSVACEPRSYTIGAHRIYPTNWWARQEPEIEETAVADDVLVEVDYGQRLAWDLTGLVRRWHRGVTPNGGVLLKLLAEEEDYGVSGPYLPSSSYPNAALRPRLVVTYSPTA